MPNDEADYKIDPYGCFSSDLVRIVKLASVNAGRMNDHEFETIQAVRKLMIERDPCLEEVM